ncbi:uncharacterized protein LOC143914046 [Arctopsyche grandis]|uniref:uncharacterized protein LOC143914046 n=1 Tax=Arctopsyche grandis TaxID=121162 RepID=UPI00406D701E
MGGNEGRESDNRSRRKRYLLEPTGTQMGLFSTISIPLENMSKVSVAYFFEANHYTLENSTWLRGDFEGPLISARGRNERSIGEESLFNSFTRRFAYVILENNIERQNLPGRECLLRAICEHSSSPLHFNGVLGDILYIVFTPSSSKDEQLPAVFYKAEMDGTMQNCEEYESTCPTSLINTFSIFAKAP